MKKNRIERRLKIVISILIMIISSQAVSGRQITDSDFFGYKPSLYDGKIAWYGYSDKGSDDKEIFYYDGKDIIQITDSGISINRPKLHNGIITWEDDDEIYYWDGTVHQLTNDINRDSEPCIYNGTIAWISHVVDTSNPSENGDDVFLWDGVSITRITDTHTSKYDLSYHNGGIVWRENDGLDDEIFYWNGSTTIQITNNDFDDKAPQIYNNMIVWWGGDDALSYEIYYWDGAIHQLTNDDVPDTNPSIYEGNIAWERVPWDGEAGIYYYDSKSKTTKQVASIEEGGGASPSLYENEIACEGLDYDDADIAANGFEIFLFDIDILDSTISSNGPGSGSGGGCFIDSLFSFSGSK